MKKNKKKKKKNELNFEKKKIKFQKIIELNFIKNYQKKKIKIKNVKKVLKLKKINI